MCIDNAILSARYNFNEIEEDMEVSQFVKEKSHDLEQGFPTIHPGTACAH